MLKHLTYDKTVRVAASGDVMITRLEREIIDTLDFQRLRGIRQLGQVHLVYPTALHTRFDHSLGTLAMAQRMIESITSNTHSTSDERLISTPLHLSSIRSSPHIRVFYGRDELAFHTTRRE
jgi:HD superfamily phosphohydrolase